MGRDGELIHCYPAKALLIAWHSDDQLEEETGIGRQET